MDKMYFGSQESNMLCIEPMKINKIPEGKEDLLPAICASGEYFAQIKKDGYWYQFEKCDTACYLWSRNKSVQTGMLTEKSENVPHIINKLNCLPSGTVIIGEIYYPGKQSKDVTPIMGALPQLAIARQSGQYGYLHYYMHDIIYYNGHNLMSYGASIRYEILKKVVDKYKLLYMNDFLELAERFDDNIQEKISEVLAAGEEGMVLKKKTAPYTPGKRPVWDTIKIKKTDTCDAICMGSCPPTKYYNGLLPILPNYCVSDENGLYSQELTKRSDNPALTWPYWVIEHYDFFNDNDPGRPRNIIDERKVPIGEHEVIKGINYKTVPVTKAYYNGWPTAIKIGAYNSSGEIIEIGTISSGLSENDQKTLAENPLAFFGHVVELAGMEKDNSAHTLRHFHFVKIRDDKDPKECTLKEIFGNE